jgi:hypothetical protein
MLPWWRNGTRTALKTQRPKGLAGSNPAQGIEGDSMVKSKSVTVEVKDGGVWLFATGEAYEQLQMMHANAMNRVLMDMMTWFRNELKYGEPDKKYKTQADAIQAARDRFAQLLDENNVPEELT